MLVQQALNDGYAIDLQGTSTVSVRGSLDEALALNVDRSRHRPAQEWFVPRNLLARLRCLPY